MEPEKPLIKLLGTAVDAHWSVAVVLDGVTKKVICLRVGEATSGWMVRSVDSRTVVVEKNGQVATVGLPTPSLKRPECSGCVAED